MLRYTAILRSPRLFFPSFRHPKSAIRNPQSAFLLSHSASRLPPPRRECLSAKRSKLIREVIRDVWTQHAP